MNLISDKNLQLFRKNYENLEHPYAFLKDQFSKFENRIYKEFPKEYEKFSKGTEWKNLNRFYSVISELKVASYLKRKCNVKFNEYGGEENRRMPDIGADGLSIEVNLPSKSIPYMAFLSFNLRKIKEDFYFFNHTFDRLPSIGGLKGEDGAVELFKKIKGKIENEETPEEGKRILYEDNKNRICCGLTSFRSEFIAGAGVNSLRYYLRESVCNKIDKEFEDDDGKKMLGLKNGLASHRPNILWTEFGLINDVEIALSDSKAYPEIETLLKNRALPKNLDAQLISISSVGSLYDDSCSHMPKFFLFLNNTEGKSVIRSFLEKLSFPNLKTYECQCYWEDLPY